MACRSLAVSTVLLGWFGAAVPARAQRADPGANRPDEPIARQYSAPKALSFLDAAATGWHARHGCFTCHTNLAYLYARPALDEPTPAHGEVRAQLEAQVRDRWPKQGPRWDAEVVAAAAALAFHDAHTTGKLHPLTRTALDRMWTTQRADGGWGWLLCDWPPMESDDHYGVTLAALAAGVAPEGYADTDAARQGLAGIRRYLRDNPPQIPHHRAMLLWAGSYVEGLVTDPERQEAVRQLRSLQRHDGGWSAAGLGSWRRADGKEQDPNTSDGYGTGFVVYVLRRSGVPSADPALRRGVAWLKANQRASGRWFTRSLNRDNKHYLSHAGTAFAVMAIAACEPRPR